MEKCLTLYKQSGFSGTPGPAAEPKTRSDRTMLEGYVEIDRLRIPARHGVMPQERAVGNMFEVTVGLRYDMERAAETDDVAFALDYSAVAAVVARVMEQPSALLENVALRLRDAIVGEFPAVMGGRVKVAKLKPPMPGQMASVSVSLEW